MSGGEKLSPEDAARLHMGSAESPMTIIVVLSIEGALPFDRVLRRVEERLLSEPRLRAHVHDPWIGAPRWSPQARLDVRQHVHRAALGARSLEDLAGELASEPLDPARPLWDLHVVEDAAEGTAIVLRVHHAIADGLALVALLARLADGDVLLPHRRQPRTSRSSIERVASAFAMARLALFVPEPPTSLRGPVTRRRELAWSRAIPLAPIRDAAHRADVGLSTLLLACTSGALRRVLEREGPVDLRLRLRAMVPVNLRHEGDRAVGNGYASAIVPLPVGLPSHEARVAMLEAQASVLSRPAAVELGRRAIAMLGKSASGLERRAIERLTRKATLVVSSVPGPERPLSIEGHRVLGVIGFAPVTGSVSLGITLLGCGGELRAGVVRASAEGPRARDIVTALEDELSGLWRPTRRA